MGKEGARVSAGRGGARNPGSGVQRTSEELAKMRRAGRVVAEVLEVTRVAIRPGVTTAQLNEIAAAVLEHRGAISSILGYRGFPAVICTSPNSMVVHGIPGEYVLREGDIISVDCAASVEGWHADAAYTASVGKVSAVARQLLEVTERSLWIGIDTMVVGQRLHEVGRAIQRVVEAAGFSVVREYVGHGIGTKMHESPDVPNYWPGSPGPTLKEGTVFAVEPAVNVGDAETYRLSDGWSVKTADGSLSAHFEHTIAVTDQGPEVFTAA